MQHMQRIPDLFHVHAGKAAPYTADSIQRSAFQREAIELGQSLIDNVAGLVGVAAGEIDETQWTEWKSERLSCPAVFHRHHVEAATAEIGGQSVGIGNSGEDALGRNVRFLFARKDANRTAPGSFSPPDEILAVWRIARCRRRDCLAGLRAMCICKQPVTGQRLKREPHTIIIKPAARHHVAADTANCFLVVHDGGRA